MPIVYKTQFHSRFGYACNTRFSLIPWYQEELTVNRDTRSALAIELKTSIKCNLVIHSFKTQNIDTRQKIKVPSRVCYIEFNYRGV